MALDPSISLNVKTPNPMDTYKSLLDIGNASNAYQQGKINLNVANQTQNAAIAQKQAESQRVVGEAPEQVAQAQTQTQQNKFNLDSAQMKLSQQLIGGLMNDDRIKSNDPNQQTDALLETESKLRSAGVPDLKLRGMMAPFYMVASHADPRQGNHIQNLLQTANNQMLSPEGQAAYNRVPVGSRESINTTPTGQQYVQAKDNNGQIIAKPLPSVGGQGAPQVAPAPGEVQSIGPLSDERNAINTAASQVSTQRFNNKQILKVLDDPSFLNQSGTGAALASKTLGSIIPGIGKDYASSTQQLAHYLALQTQSNEKAMGVSTDAGRHTSDLATGSVEMTPTALKNATKVNDATASALQNYNIGMENAVKNAGGDVRAVRGFKNAWSQVYTPEIMILHNAIEDGDKDQINELIKANGGKGSAKMGEIVKRSKILDSLIKTGAANGL